MEISNITNHFKKSITPEQKALAASKIAKKLLFIKLNSDMTQAEQAVFKEKFIMYFTQDLIKAKENKKADPKTLDSIIKCLEFYQNYHSYFAPIAYASMGAITLGTIYKVLPKIY